MKDDFPFTNIEMLMDITTRHEMLSVWMFLWIQPNNDYQKGSTKNGLHLSMDNILLECDATHLKYQRAMELIFHGMIHKAMKDYVDDTLDKSRKRRDHIAALSAIFDRLEEYKVFLNPNKCVFRI